MAYQMIPSVKPNKQKGERFLKCKFELEIVFWRKSFERPSQSGKMGVLSKWRKAFAKTFLKCKPFLKSSKLFHFSFVSFFLSFAKTRKRFYVKNCIQLNWVKCLRVNNNNLNMYVPRVWLFSFHNLITNLIENIKHWWGACDLNLGLQVGRCRRVQWSLPILRLKKWHIFVLNAHPAHHANS